MEIGHEPVLLPVLLHYHPLVFQYGDEVTQSVVTESDTDRGVCFPQSPFKFLVTVFVFQGECRFQCNAVLLFGGTKERKQSACIRCGRCVRACPMKLMPLKIASAIQQGNTDEAATFGALDCIECGTCSYICPGGVPVTQLTVRAKQAVLEQRRNHAKHEG